MNILIFTPTPTHPQNAGNRERIFSVARELQRIGHVVNMVYFTQEGLSIEQEESMRKTWDSLTIIRKVIQYRKSSPNYYMVDDWYQDGLGQQIAELCSIYKIDIVLCNYIFQSKILEFLPPHITKVIDAIDRFTDRDITLRKAGIEPDYFYTSRDQEKLGLLRADIVLAIQDSEKAYFQQLLDTDPRVSVRTVGHIEEKKECRNALALRRRVGFIGSGNSLNLRYLTEFIDTFLSSDEVKKIGIKLIVAGSVCSKIDGKYNQEQVECVGYIDNPADFYSQVDVCINPLLLGTGLKIKTVQALSYGTPVISSEEGFIGIPSTAPFHRCKDQADILEWLVNFYIDEACRADICKRSSESFQVYESKTRHDLSAIFAPKPKITIATHIDFWHNNLGSRVRLLSLLRYLSTRYYITILYLSKAKPIDRRLATELGIDVKVAFIEDYQRVPIQKNIDFSTYSTIQSFSFELCERFNGYLQTCTFDILVIEYITFAYLAEIPDSSIVRVLDTHDIMHLRAETFKAAGLDHWIEISLSQERAIYNKFDGVMLIQKEEAEYAKSLSLLARTILAPIAQEISTSSHNELVQKIVYVGGRSNVNIASIRRFILTVWCMLKHKESLSLHIYGGVCEGVKDLEHVHRLILHNEVISQSEIYQDADICINPAVAGGGLKVKSVEALCRGLPLVCSRIAAEGFSEQEDRIFLLAETADDYIKQILLCSLSQEVRATLAKNAIEFCQQTFSEDACYGPLAEALAEMLEEKRGRQGNPALFKSSVRSSLN